MIYLTETGERGKETVKSDMRTDEAKFCHSKSGSCVRAEIENALNYVASEKAARGFLDSEARYVRSFGMAGEWFEGGDAPIHSLGCSNYT